jgi:alcohol dehydrogenase class IV
MLFIAAFLINRASQSSYNLTGRSRSTGLGRQIRYMYPEIGQGTVGAAMTVHNMRLNQDIMLRGQPSWRKSGIRTPEMSEEEASEAAIHYVETFLKSIGVPTRLRDLGVKKEDFRALAELDAREPAFGEGGNRVTDVDELVGILERAW